MTTCPPMPHPPRRRGRRTVARNTTRHFPPIRFGTGNRSADRRPPPVLEWAGRIGSNRVHYTNCFFWRAPVSLPTLPLRSALLLWDVRLVYNNRDSPSTRSDCTG